MTVSRARSRTLTLGLRVPTSDEVVTAKMTANMTHGCERGRPVMESTG